MQSDVACKLHDAEEDGLCRVDRWIQLDDDPIQK